MSSKSRLKLVIFVLAVTAFTLETPAVTSAQEICDPIGTPGVYWPTGYCTHGYTFSPATIRLEFLETDLQGGDPVLVRQIDVNVLQTWSVPENPNYGPAWGQRLLQAIADQNDLVVAGQIIRCHVDGSQNMNEYCDQGCIPCDFLKMTVNAVPGKRIALRAISTANRPLPPHPSMPPLAGGSSPWPPAPQQLSHSHIMEGTNYDYVRWGGEQPSPLGLIGAHYIAVWPDWGTVSGMILDGNDEPNIPPGYSAYATAFPMPVPTISEWGMIVMGGALLTVGAIAIVRRRRMIMA